MSVTPPLEKTLHNSNPNFSNSSRSRRPTLSSPPCNVSQAHLSLVKHNIHRGWGDTLPTVYNTAFSSETEQAWRGVWWEVGGRAKVAGGAGRVRRTIKQPSLVRAGSGARPGGGGAGCAALVRRGALAHRLLQLVVPGAGLQGEPQLSLWHTSAGPTRAAAPPPTRSSSGAAALAATARHISQATQRQRSQVDAASTAC